MKVLILSITAGQGHHNSGKALVDGLEAQGAQCLMIDTLEHINNLIKGSVEYGYLALTEHSPHAFGAGYRLAEKRNKSESRYAPVRLTSKLMSKKLENLITEFGPDAIVCTHPFPAQYISELRIRGTSTYGIITDFTIHPFWEETNLDYYVTPSPFLENQMEKKGIPSEKMLPLGIPVNPKFSYITDKIEARKKLGIPDKTTIFFISGSMGFGNIPKQIKKLINMSLDFQIIAVSGRNERMKRKIDRIAQKSDKKIFSFGFVDNIDVIMDASDFMVTKPGGLTVSEGLAKELPLILTDPIPGQEDRNVEFLLNNGLAMLATSTFPIDECIYQLMTNTTHLEQIKNNIRKAARPDSAKQLSEFIINQRRNNQCSTQD